MRQAKYADHQGPLDFGGALQKAGGVAGEAADDGQKQKAIAIKKELESFGLLLQKQMVLQL